MPIIDKRGKVFGKVNVIDLFIMIMIIALSVGTYLKVKTVDSDTFLKPKPIDLRLTVRDREEFSLDKIKVGDVLKEYDTGIVLGKIKNIEVENMTEEVETVDGQIKIAEEPDRFRLYIDVEANATVTENAIMSGNKELRVGSKLVLKTQLYALDSTVLKVEEKE